MCPYRWTIGGGWLIVSLVYDRAIRPFFCQVEMVHNSRMCLQVLDRVITGMDIFDDEAQS